MGSKTLIFGATGAVGSSLAKLLNVSSSEIHLIAKNEAEVSKLSEETNCSYSVADVTDPSFLEKIDKDLQKIDIKGIAYCVGSIDLKPINLVTKKFFINTKDNRSLNPKSGRWGYAVFGTVIEGMEIVDKISKKPTGQKGRFTSDVPIETVLIMNISIE